MTATRAERLFFGAPFQGGALCCGRGGMMPQDMVDRDALPPSTVLGYSDTLFRAPSVPRLEKLSKGCTRSSKDKRGCGKCGNPCRCRFGRCLGSPGTGPVGLAESAETPQSPQRETGRLAKPVHHLDRASRGALLYTSRRSLLIAALALPALAARPGLAQD